MKTRSVAGSYGIGYFSRVQRKIPSTSKRRSRRHCTELSKRFDVREVRFDPYQMRRPRSACSVAGLPMVEFPQSVPKPHRSVEQPLRADQGPQPGRLSRRRDPALDVARDCDRDDPRMAHREGKGAPQDRRDRRARSGRIRRHAQPGSEPGITGYYRERAERRPRGETPAEDTSLWDEYWRIRDEIRRSKATSICRGCKKPLGSDEVQLIRRATGTTHNACRGGAEK